jgi:hypothetical protein
MFLVKLCPEILENRLNGKQAPHLRLLLKFVARNMLPAFEMFSDMMAVFIEVAYTKE